MILSPGMGLQQPLRLTFISFIPSTKTSFLITCFLVAVVFLITFSSVLFFLLIILVILEMVYLPEPKAMYKSSKSFKFRVSNISSK